ncbi:heavy metal-associated isoprenylated plant protein 16 [Herrania umbratica]|uniref:Heavy metal-associated isoprenylated plant protein 16 n=1 Tax=Herrania umbratica TaxID=108875 RepID=A0A6J0ZI54_9ROSI|nr:heavy metal-associated isoprenylated plant protein 16 [Herrania umbratica]
MKQKMVVKVTMNGHKSRSKALKIAVGLAGVESASLIGDDKSQIEITGDGVDPVQLTSLLRKSVGHAELVSVSAVGGEKKEEPEKEKPKPTEPYVWPYNPPYYVYQVPDGYAQFHDPSCSIM